MKCSDEMFFNMAVICDGEREYWLARDLMELFPFSWDEFLSFIEKTQEECKKEKKCLVRHNFIYINRLCVVDGKEVEIPDYRLSCYACFKLMDLIKAKHKNAQVGRNYFHKKFFGE